MLRRILIAFALWLVTLAVATAQDEHLQVEGLITATNNVNKSEPLDRVRIYSYYTHDDAKDAKKRWQEESKKNRIDFDPGYAIGYTMTEEDGHYEIAADPAGYILYIYLDNPDAEPVIKAVKKQTKINVSFETSSVLDQAVVTAGANGAVRQKRPPKKKQKGNLLIYGNTYAFPRDRMGASNVRFAMQPYVLGATGDDTLGFRKPVVMDGKDYRLTQIRRMGYESRRDPLLEISSQFGELTDTTIYVSYEDTIYLANAKQRCFVSSKIWMEDYNMVFFTDTMMLYDGRPQNDMQFLDYTLQPYDLDYNAYNGEYRRTPVPQDFNDERKLSLQFLKGQAKLDPADTVGAAQLQELKDELYNIEHGEGSRLSAFTIKGVASPEGTYARNVSLAKERMEWMRTQIESALAHKPRETTNSEVAQWTDVADTLEFHSHKDVADDIRQIVEKYPSNMDQQWAKIRAMRSYGEIIDPMLPNLRTVTFSYIYRVHRILTPAEILHRYNTDPDYRSGKQEFTANEFWHLFQMVKNQDELDALYQRALKMARREDKKWPWPLAANLVAEYYIRKEKIDTLLLKPYINFDDNLFDRCNRPWTLEWSGASVTYNPDPIVANQVVMYLRAGRYDTACDLAEYLPRDKYSSLYYVTRCLADRYEDFTKTEYDIIAQSSPQNAVVIYMAMGDMALADEALDKMDPEKAITWYLKAQYLCRIQPKTFNYALIEDNDKDNLVSTLVKSFKIDPKYIEIARFDGYIFKELYKDAEKEYNNPGSVVRSVTDDLGDDPFAADYPF